jgi:hypothetical protein
LGRDERKMEKKRQGQHNFIKYQLTRNEWMNMPNHHLFYLLCCSVDHNCSCWHRSRIDRTWSSCVCGALIRSSLLDASLTLTNPNDRKYVIIDLKSQQFGKLHWKMSRKG